MNRLLILFLLTAGGCEILETDISEKRVEILAPTDKAVVAAGSVDFHWCALQHAAGYEFTLAFPSFGNAARIVADTVVYADSLDRWFRFRTELQAGTYEWRVSAFNGAYESLGEIRSLTVE